MLHTVMNTMNYAKRIFCCGGKPVDVTYSQLSTMISTNRLKPGSWYRITDFQTIYDQPDYDGSGNPKVSVVTKTAAVEPLLVLAITSNSISKHALSTVHENDEIDYDVTFNETEVMGAPAKGRITKRIDDRNNRTDYDHRVVLFKRYDIGGGNLFNDRIDNGFWPSQEFLTFSVHSYNNYIGNLLDRPEDAYPFLLANNVFKGNTHDNIFGNYCYGNTFTSSVEGNIVGSEFFHNVITGYFHDNRIGHRFANNYIGSSFLRNSIVFGFDDNTIFGEQFSYNHIQQGFQNNTVVVNFTECILLSMSNCNVLTFFRINSNAPIASVNFNGATLITTTYNKTFFLDSAGALKVSYINGSGVLQVTNPTA